MSKHLCCCLTGQEHLDLSWCCICADSGTNQQTDVWRPRELFPAGNSQSGEVRVQTLKLISFLLLLNKESGLFLRKPRISFHFFLLTACFWRLFAAAACLLFQSDCPLSGVQQGLSWGTRGRPRGCWETSRQTQEVCKYSHPSVRCERGQSSSLEVWTLLIVLVCIFRRQDERRAGRKDGCRSSEEETFTVHPSGSAERQTSFRGELETGSQETGSLGDR